VLYIGLGVNYAVHYLLRYREIALIENNRVTAVVATGRFLWRALLLSAVTTALGFFAFVPTSFSGIAQLGLIAGVAMLVTLILSYTALPAMLAWIRPDPSHRVPEPGRGWRRALDWPLRRRLAFSVLGALLLIAALPLASGLRFDADPLNLRDAGSESVHILRRLFEAGDGGYRNIQVLLEPDVDPTPLADQLRQLPTVERVVTLASFEPAGQDDKLMLLEDLGWVLGPDLLDSNWAPGPPDPARLAAAAAALRAALPTTGTAGGRALHEALQRIHDRLGDAAAEPRSSTPQALAARIDQALVGAMAGTLGRLTHGLELRQPVAAGDLPEWLRRQFVGIDGSQLIQVFPAVNVNDFEQQRRFTEQVLDVAGDRATGGPVIQLAAGEAITAAFRQAMLWAVFGIGLVLLLALRSVSAAARVLAPLALGGLLTGAAMALLDIPFNFANVVALPLLLGVAVDNGIHLVLRHRAGLLPDGNVLHSATARAIVFGALITAGGFGNLAFSPHAGTASLGVVLAIGLALMVLATLVFLPALLGRRAA
jgi:hopanoid biosynthesis associated RND transporter like protein HpnN